MANGKPGDHPVFDVSMHRLPVFGEPTDGELRQVVRLLGYHRAYEWFDTLRGRSEHEQRAAILLKLAELRRDAQERGWEADL